MQKTITLGLMSGTSLDGVDAVAVDFAGSVPQFRGHYHVPFTDEMRAELLALCTPGNNEIDRMGRTSVELAKIYAHAIAELLNTADIPRKEVAAAGSHGQTIRHRPEEGWTLQLNNPAMVAELSGLNVIADFRSRDVAAGGEGAPLVPAFHAQVFTGNVARSIVNIGGISNITFLPPVKSYGSVTGFDCGPGNILLDAWCAKHLERPYDAGGRWAATGTVNEALLTRLMAEPYLRRNRRRALAANSLTSRGSKTSSRNSRAFPRRTCRQPSPALPQRASWTPSRALPAAPKNSTSAGAAP